MQIYSSSALEALHRAAPPREAFGPGSDHPLLAISLDNCAEELAGWLSDMPCPVIGIGSKVGKAALASACDMALDDQHELPIIARNIEAAPVAAMILVQLLRMSEKLSLTDALLAESFAYATIQQGPEFRAWQGRAGEQQQVAVTDNPLIVERQDDTLKITLTDPDNRNAIGVNMRDALCDALDLALGDAQISRIVLTGGGRTFSTGGEVAEFGHAADPATAHHIRTLRWPAWRLARLGERLEVSVSGAAIGAGAEMSAFGSKVSASPSAWFQLPELKYGLIPGAGGTASLPRRIGRQRTAYLALSMKRVDAQTALEWGLVDEVLS